jgi:CRISPR-associated protein Cas5d
MNHPQRPPGPGHPPLTVEVWGEAALFTRPELKAERVTYPVMTPGAAKGVLEAIYWKPEMYYRVLAIEVLERGSTFVLRRNETHDVAPLAEAAKGTRRIDTAATRDQRSALCLKDVRYRIHAQIGLRPHATKPVAAYRDQFRRRVDKGACFAQPYLGTREFTAYFSKPTDQAPIPVNEQLGIMLHSVDYRTGESTWFRASLEDGVMTVPAEGEADLVLGSR